MTFKLIEGFWKRGPDQVQSNKICGPRWGVKLDKPVNCTVGVWNVFKSGRRVAWKRSCTGSRSKSSSLGNKKSLNNNTNKKTSKSIYMGGQSA